MKYLIKEAQRDIDFYNHILDLAQLIYAQHSTHNALRIVLWLENKITQTILKIAKLKTLLTTLSHVLKKKEDIMSSIIRSLSRNNKSSTSNDDKFINSHNRRETQRVKIEQKL